MSLPIKNVVVVVMSAVAFLALANSTKTEDASATEPAITNLTNITKHRGCYDGLEDVNGTTCVDLDMLACVGALGGCVLAGWVAFALMLPCVLLAFGFGVIGIVEGSLAAAFQSSHGTPYCFRCAQSTAMLSTPCYPRIFFGLIGAVLVGVLAYNYVPLPFCFEEQEPLCYCFGNEGWRSTVAAVGNGWDSTVAAVDNGWNSTVAAVDNGWNSTVAIARAGWEKMRAANHSDSS